MTPSRVDSERVRVPLAGCASEKGPDRPTNADAYAEHTEEVGYGVFGVTDDRYAVCVVDGTGRGEAVTRFARHAAWHAAVVAARRDSPMLGVLAVTEVAGGTNPDGAMVVAVARQGQPWRVGVVGDCSVWAWDGTIARRVTTPQTLGQKFRDWGEDEATARLHDHKLYHGIGRANLHSVPTATMPQGVKLIALVSDGMKLAAEQVTLIFSQFEHDRQACAEELVAEARAAGSGDDIAAVVAIHPDLLAAESAAEV